MAAVYTKDEILNLYPCLQCLNKSELLAVLVYVLATLNGKDVTTDLSTMMDDSACYNCLTEKQMLEGLIASLATNVIPAETTVTQMREYVKCLTCVDPNRIRALLLNEWTTYTATL